MIPFFGPLLGLWTMQFEVKHSFSKQAVHNTNCFKIIPHSLAATQQTGDIPRCLPDICEVPGTFMTSIASLNLVLWVMFIFRT